MVQLEEWRDRFAALGVNVGAMTYDDRSVLAAFHASQGLGYPLLQDEGARHMTAYGVRDLAYSPGDRGYGIPYPGIVFVAPDGIVRAKFAVPGYRQRPPFELVYQMVEKLVHGE